LPRLAPLYDMLPIRLDDRYTHQLAFNIGNATHFDDMSAEDLAAFLIQCGVADGPDFVEAAVVPLVERLEEAARTLRSLQLRRFDNLIGRETDRLVDLFSAAVDVRERDSFEERGGGWLQGS